MGNADRAPRIWMRVLMLVGVLVAALLSGLARAAEPGPQAGNERGAGETHLLLMGGGPRAGHSQVALEKNIQFFDRVQQRIGLASDHRTILFAAGQRDEPDIVYEKSGEDPPSLRRMLSVVVGPDDDFSERIRQHQLPAKARALTKDNIRGWFNTHRQRIAGEDQAIFYFTGHGGHAPEKDGEDDQYQSQNTSLYLWGNDRTRARAFTRQLDKLPKDTRVVTVMVQCYSGGFANMIFKGGDPANGLSEHNRCGFFSATYDRTAAGCTAQINEADYQDYSTHFFAAVAGETRLGEPIDKPDYDNDGEVGLDEAHVYTLLNNTSIDVPVRTSERFLRHFSKMRVDGESAERAQAEDAQLGLDRPAQSPLAKDASYAALLDAAEPIRRRALRGLNDRLELDGDDWRDAIEDRIKQAKQRRKKLHQKRHKIQKKTNHYRQHMRRDLLKRWPALENPWRKDAQQAVEREGEAIRAELRDHKHFKQLLQASKKLKQLKSRMRQQRGIVARGQRFRHTAKSVILAANLPHCASDQIVESYETLLKREGRPLK